MSTRISYLTAHLRSHHKDHVTRRALVGLVSKRRRVMQYLLKKDPGTRGWHHKGRGRGGGGGWAARGARQVALRTRRTGD